MKTWLMCVVCAWKGRWGQTLLMKRRLSLCLLALMLLFHLPAQGLKPVAPLSPGLAAIQAAFTAGKPHGLYLTAKLTAWPDLAESSLAHLQTLVEKLRLQLWFRDDKAGSAAQGRLSHAGQEWLAFGAVEHPGQPYLDLMAGEALPATRYLGREDSPPWQMLLGQAPFVPQRKQAGEALSALWDAAYPLLASYEKPVQTGITIKNAGRSQSQLVYALKAGEAQLAWDSLVAGQRDSIGLLIDSLLPAAQARQVKDNLFALSFTGNLTIKRFLDDAGQDLGIQVTATVKTGEQTRRLTLFGGQSADGFYLSLKLPATRGNDTLEVQLSLKTKPGQWQGDWRTLLRTAKESTTITGKLALESHMEDNGESLAGDISLNIRQSGSSRDSRSYAFSPSLRFENSGANGTLGIQEQAGKTVLRQLELGISLVPGWGDILPPAAQTVQLDTLSPAQLALAQARVQGALAPRLTAWFMGIPLAERQLLLHDIGREQRTLGDSVPAPENIDNTTFLVLKDTFEEGTP